MPEGRKPGTTSSQTSWPPSMSTPSNFSTSPLTAMIAGPPRRAPPGKAACRDAGLGDVYDFPLVGDQTVVFKPGEPIGAPHDEAVVVEQALDVDGALKQAHNHQRR